MSQQLINRSPDLKRLRDEGYEVAVEGGHLVVHHIPYVTKTREIKYGKLISSLTLNNNVTVKPDNHVIHFMGEHPCNNDGSIITAIQHANPNQQLADGLIMNYSFSNKPKNGYADYYQKVTRYAEIITAPAKSIDPTATAKTFRVVEDQHGESMFHYIDTNSSRANINLVNSRLNGQRIGIIGLGGTGSYILDFVAKTPVAGISLFDGDVFLQHNAFRSPGSPSIETLNTQVKKVDYFTAIYSRMHKGIRAYPVNVTADNIELLKNHSYVFICVDSNSARSMIMTWLRQFGITFIDVGLGVNMADNNLVGMVRVTTATPSKHDHIPSRIGAAGIDENEYSTNIQIAELNALNALLAVIKWKKLSGFYQDLKEEHHTTYTINTAQLIHDDFTA